MRKQLHRSIFGPILVMVLLLTLPGGATAVQSEATPTLSPTEPTATVAPTEVPTEPSPTEPVQAEPAGLTVDTNSQVYRICDELAQKMEARQIFVYATATDTLLYTKTVDTGKLYPASITKLFSARVALQYLDPEAVITAGDELDLVHEGSSLAYISRNTQVRVKELVEGMMLPSGNDAAIVLATAAGRLIAKDESISAADAVQVFVDEMNRQAEELGFEKTHFSNPDGWHIGSHYTCLNDLARIAELALENETIRRYMRLYKDETSLAGGQYVIWENTNLLLNPEAGYYRTDAIGMKTGYTRPAGYCLMSAFTFDEGEIVVGLFGYTSKYERFNDAIRLVNAVKEQLRLEAKLQQEMNTSPSVG